MSGARAANEQDLFGGPGEGTPSIHYGTVGWDDAEEYYELGTAENGGRTLVRVQLFEGRDLTKPPVPGLAGGHRILVQVMAPLYVIPPKGKLVVVFFPGNAVTAPGAGVINGWVDNSPTVQFSATRAVLDVGAGMDLVVKGKSVTLSDHGADEGRFACYATIGPPPAGGDPGIVLQDPTGSGIVIANGVVGAVATDGGSPSAGKCCLNLSKNQFFISLDGAGMMKCSAAGNMTIGCKGVAYVGGKQTMIGAVPTVATPALYGPAGPAGVASTNVFVSP